LISPDDQAVKSSRSVCTGLTPSGAGVQTMMVPPGSDHALGRVLGFVGLPEIQVAGIGIGQNDIRCFVVSHTVYFFCQFDAGRESRTHVAEKDPHDTALAVHDDIENRPHAHPIGHIVHIPSHRVIGNAQKGITTAAA
jgi:hypothetical protein